MRAWILAHTDIHRRHGGKRHRRRQVSRLIAALEDIQGAEPAVFHPNRVGKAQIHRFYARHSEFASSTQRDYHYAFCLLWRLLGRTGQPPAPSKVTA